MRWRDTSFASWVGIPHALQRAIHPRASCGETRSASSFCQLADHEPQFYVDGPRFPGEGRCADEGGHQQSPWVGSVSAILRVSSSSGRPRIAGASLTRASARSYSPSPRSPTLPAWVPQPPPPRLELKRRSVGATSSFHAVQAIYRGPCASTGAVYGGHSGPLPSPLHLLS